MDNKQAIMNMKQGKNIPYKHETIATLTTMADKLESIEQIIKDYGLSETNFLTNNDLTDFEKDILEVLEQYN